MKVFEDMQQYIRECVAACDGIHLYGCEMIPGHKGNTLRVFIDADNRAVSADDCHKAGQQIRAQAAVSFPSILSYTIEVSSPGLDRILFNLEHCQKHIGSRIKCKTKRSIDGRKNFTGKLNAIDGNDIILLVDEQLISIDWQDVDKIRLIYEPE